jgi:hypothetical protein
MIYAIKTKGYAPDCRQELQHETQWATKSVITQRRFKYWTYSS